MWVFIWYSISEIVSSDSSHCKHMTLPQQIILTPSSIPAANHLSLKGAHQAFGRRGHRCRDPRLLPGRLDLPARHDILHQASTPWTGGHRGECCHNLPGEELLLVYQIQ